MNALAVVLSLAVGAFAVAMALGCAAPADSRAAGGSPDAAGASAGTARSRSGPLRVLVLSGGEFHDFDGNLKSLIDGMSLPADTQWSFLPLGDDSADGVSRALRLRQLETLELPGEHDVILAYTQGERGLSPTAKDKLLAFVRSGGGFVGLHCAADSHPGWTGYTTMLGGRFESHPPFGDVTVQLTPSAASHPVTRGLPDRWTLKDEFYHLQDLQLDDATLLMTGVSPLGGEKRPVTWAKPYGQGRVVYTILGHGPEAHADPRYHQLVAQAVLWAAGRDS
jgi:hypothetical protein